VRRKTQRNLRVKQEEKEQKSKMLEKPKKTIAPVLKIRTSNNDYRNHGYILN
jgi:hypothetical protein